jgi:Heterokaryon incompatibility protein (HET)
MDGSWTRLVNIQSGRVERYSITEIPPYIAISHTWADKLFPPGVPFSESSGSRAVHSLSQTEYKDTNYCWIDTLSIDQVDDEDKQRQIPLMGLIYGNAVVVAIVTKEPFGLSQEQIDSVTGSVQGAVDMSTNSLWLQEGKQWTSLEKNRRRLKRAMDCLEVFTRPVWGSRVWTMQEFILAKKTIWIGSELKPLRIDERMFQAIPEVCNYLSIEECLISKYAKLYHHFSGMAGAHFQLIDSTRVMELLGNRTATVPEDEVYGLMAASSVVLQETNVKGKEKVWAMWWEEALRTGHFRWALLPPAIPEAPDSPSTQRNCIMPAFSVRHLTSANSALDSVQPYGEVEVKAGTVSMIGRLAGRCDMIRKLGRVCLDHDGVVARDITLILFASNSWRLALRIAAAFGAGRYNVRQRMIIAQVLLFNYYKAKLAVLSQKTKSFRPRFRNHRQASIWSDFMLLQTTHAMVINDSVAFLAKISTGLKSTDIIVATDGERPSGCLWAIDFGAINDSEKTMFTIVKDLAGTGGAGLSASCQGSASPSLHRAGVSMYMQVVDNLAEANRYASHILEQPQTSQRFNIGGTRCPVCSGLASISAGGVSPNNNKLEGDCDLTLKSEGKASTSLIYRTRLEMRKQIRASKTRWRKRRLRLKVVAH